MKNDFRFDDSRDENLTGFSLRPEQDEQDAPAGDQSAQTQANSANDSDWSYERFFRDDAEPQPLPEEPGEPERTTGQPVSEKAAAPVRKAPAKRKKRSGCLKTFIWIAIIGLVSVGLAIGILLVARDILAIGKSDTLVSVEIKPGMSTTQIAEQLKKQGIIDYPLVFRLYSKFMKYDGTFRYGVYLFSPESGYEAIAESLQKEGAQEESTKITIKEGMRLDDIFAAFEEKEICSVSNLKKAMEQEKFSHKFLQDIPREKVKYYLEGYLFPDTYQFFPNDSVAGAKMVLDTMLNNLDKKLTSADYAQAARRKFTMHEIITMASIIELEASGSPDEMAKVSAVFFNRLAWTTEPNLLGSTPTTKYAKTYRDNRYDTNITPGLPPGPLNSPSLGAIKAALYPEKGFGYYYFVTDKQMNFYYNKTLSEHNATVKRLQAENNWVY